ncbi:MAG: alpha-mannosidase [Ignavibacteriales bacterium]|nr:alpha-mannosidase [Ignavibacteriales bacterium]
MAKKIEDIYTKRINQFQNSIKSKFFINEINFDAKYYKTKDQVLFRDRLEGEYKKITPGEIWGNINENAWFNLTGKIPENWKNKKIVAKLNFTGEALIFSNDGIPLQALTSSSVYNPEFKRDLFTLHENCSGGEKIELWIEAVSMGYLGVNQQMDPAPESKNRYGEFNSIVNDISFGIFNENLWHMYLDIEVLNRLSKQLPEKSVRRSRIIRNVNKALDIYFINPENIHEARSILKIELDKPASSSELDVTAVGHAHIDTAWLWTVSETIRKCGRTFSNQIKLLEKYPEYVFGASQPQHYDFTKKYYPDVYEKIKKYVKEGRWELQGGMWVEADANLISGESMIRQILYGKNFFMDEFGYDVKNLWLPDVFGYSAAIPQILRKSGIDYFLTQKISWSQINEFPYNSFIWRGIDGSDVISHFPPENNYNSDLTPGLVISGRDNFKEKDFLDEFLSLYGVGNGGGGPKEENIEFGLRMKNLEGAPKIKFGRADEFFERLKKFKDELPLWVGELYLELHRGTLTTQALVKKQNRKLELRLRELEILYSATDVKNYPAEEFNQIWKKVLINQFHDIIPGSSINETYKVTHSEYNQAFDDLTNLENNIANILFNQNDNAITFFNSLSHKYEGRVELPEEWSYGLIDKENNLIPVQKENDRFIANLSIGPLSFLTLYKSEKYDKIEIKNEKLILENILIKYEFNDEGNLISAFDKELNIPILAENSFGNILSLYDDNPSEWDAWDVDITYENTFIENAKADKVEKSFNGNVRSGIEFHYILRNSEIIQLVTLQANSKRLDFETKVNWHEKHKMLRVSFPVNVFTDQASFDIQYGYLKRNTHRNTSWDFAKFEVAAHKYADLSQDNFGVAILNDCKYGHKVLGNVLDLNLLRSTTYPDPDADIGEHKFTYSILPHKGNLINSNVFTEAAKLNQGIMCFPGMETNNNNLPCKIMSDGISIEVIKKAEKSNDLILRLVEYKGLNSKGKIVFGKYPVKISETNLIEWEENPTVIIESDFEIELKPFEIRTYRINNPF